MPKAQRKYSPESAHSGIGIAPGKKSAPIPRQSLSSVVVERLREKIISGELREGEQLRQDAIATEFQISRIPVREALSHLAAEGLIKIVANRGAVVSALSPEEIVQLFETRAVLECYALRQAIPNLKEEDFRRAEDILEHFEKSLMKDSEIRSWGAWNWSFHSILYAPAKRPVLMSFLKTLNNNCDRYTRLHLLVTRDLHRAGQSHRGLLDACRTRDPEVAATALWAHITEAGEYLKEFIHRHRERHP
ncbi:MAG TPA: GntR family transcriptional regulator [Candidatus Acidoferrales bacterium]|nr:GntR family transcriptional regulator [Candidatus Acidoferrales bacterium]